MYPIEVRAMIIVEEEIRAKRMRRRENRARFVYGNVFHPVTNPYGGDLKEFTRDWLERETREARDVVERVVRHNLRTVLAERSIPDLLCSLVDQIIDHGWLNFASAPTDILQDELRAVVELRRAERVTQQTNILRRHNRSQMGSL